MFSHAPYAYKLILSILMTLLQPQLLYSTECGEISR